MKKDIKELTKKLTYTRKNFFKKAGKHEVDASFDFAKGYKTFLDECKTERETVIFTEKLLTEKGFKPILENSGDKKVYATFHKKTMAFAIIGEKPISEGVNVIASHIDSPRVDLKQNPLYEDGGLSMGIMRTHYYGGVRKYQWMSTPLAIHGTVVKKDGSIVNIVIGEDDNDPVFVMPDLLPHLSRKAQGGKSLGEAISAANMNVIFNTMPYIDDEEEDIKDAVKLKALVMLNEKYGITENDFLSAEIELIPAGKARDCGLDSSMVLGYGQDDRVCAYTSLMALLNAEKLDRTAVILFADKEEVGSDGNTGAKSIFMYDFIGDLLKHNNEDTSERNLRKTVINSQILSADVNAAINPNYPSVHEKANAVHFGYGVSLTKYTGAGGKGGTSDANAEFMARLGHLFDDENVFWQYGSLGKVDEGGGGTIAKFLANQGASVIDCGTGVLGMHSLYELTSKADVYSTYKAYKIFIEKA